MKTIISIGGGNLLKNETLKIDKYIVKLVKKKNPRVLLIPTASNDSTYFVKTFKKIYGKKLGCEVDILNLIKEKLTKKEINDKIMSADIVYVGDGNPKLLYKVWKRRGIDKILRKAWNKGTIMSGKSSGGHCWCNEGLGSREIRTYKGFGFVNINFVAHYTDRHRKVIFENLRKLGKPVVALTDGAAIEIKGNRYRIIRSLKNAKAYILTIKKGEVIKEELPLDNKFRRIGELR